MKNEYDTNLKLAETLSDSWMQPSKTKQHYKPAKVSFWFKLNQDAKGLLIGCIISAPFIVQTIIDIHKG